MEMLHFTSADLTAWDRQYRIDFVHGLSGFRTAFLLGSMSASGIRNLSIIHSVMHIGASPAWLSYISRPEPPQRDSWQNIQESGVYSLNMVTETLRERAHQTSAKFTPEEDEFMLCGIEAQQHDGFGAPFVAESPVQIGLRFVESHLLGNGCRMIIGEIQDVWLKPTLVLPDGHLALENEAIQTVLGLDSYFGIRGRTTLPHAKR